MNMLDIRILGDFSLRMGDRMISDNDNRTKKGWMLLAYLLCHRGRVVSQKELIRLLWGDSPSSSNPENALRITFHRLRGQLDQLWPTAGRDLILYKDAGYSWNTQIPMTLDSDLFEELCRGNGKDPAARLQDCRRALSLYGGDFLEKQSSEMWVIPISTHYHNLFIELSMEAAALLSDGGEHQEAVAVCRSAISAEPYQEQLYQVLMRELAALGDQEAAAKAYEELRKRLFDDFGIQPGEETKAVYRGIVHTISDNSLSLDTVMDHLQEPENANGAMLCEYDYFKVLCYAESRSMERSGKATHVALLSVSESTGGPLPKRSAERIMQQLGDQIGQNLRRGDIYSRCSQSQYIIMLPEANYENSCMVCRRVIAAFGRRHPHVTAKINYMVQPLTVNISVP